MKFSGFMALACAAALSAACTGDVREENRSVTETEQAEPTGDRVGTTGDERIAAGETGGATGVSGNARDFVERVTHSSMAEVQLGQMAGERAQNAEVKQFGQMMVRDHSKASDELKQILSPYNVTMPTELDDEHRDLIEKLRNLRGAEFDREYMAAMVDGHRDMQGLLEERAEERRNDPQSPGQANPAAADERRDSVDAALNQWALKTKPAVDRHLETAEQIQEKLQGANRTN